MSVKKNYLRKALRRKGINLPDYCFEGQNALRLVPGMVFDLSIFSKLQGCYFFIDNGTSYITYNPKNKHLYPETF